MFHGDRVSVWEDEKVLETDGGDGYTTKGTYLTPLKGALKKMVNSTFCVFNHNVSF